MTSQGDKPLTGPNHYQLPPLQGRPNNSHLGQEHMSKGKSQQERPLLAQEFWQGSRLQARLYVHCDAEFLERRRLD